MIKKTLSIIILSLLIITPSSSDVWDKLRECTLKCKMNNLIENINPKNYLEKRKRCKGYADNADTVYIGKQIYKECMK